MEFHQILYINRNCKCSEKRFSLCGKDFFVNFNINENFEEIHSTLMLAEKFYENSFHSINEIPISFRFSILVARRVYRKIGYKVIPPLPLLLI